MNELFVRDLELPIYVKSGDSHHNFDNDVSLRIHQKCVGDVGCVVWDAALVLLKFLFTESGNQYINNKHVLELGSGTGVVGLAACLAGAASSVVTDLPKHLSLMKLNIQENVSVLSRCCVGDERNALNVQADVLRWGNKLDLEQLYLNSSLNSIKSFSKVQCVLIADCIYYEDGMINLYDTIVTIMTSSDNDCKVLCCYESRDAPEKVSVLRSFMKLLAANSLLKLSYVPHSDMDDLYQSKDIHILLICKSSEIS